MSHQLARESCENRDYGSFVPYLAQSISVDKCATTAAMRVN